MLLLPVFPETSSNFTYDIQIEDQICIIKCLFNIRNQCFHLDFTDGNDNIIKGIKMVPNFPLLKYKKGFTDLQGDLFLLPITAAAGSIVTYDNFGTDWGFYYLTEDEVEDWETENGL